MDSHELISEQKDLIVEFYTTTVDPPFICGAHGHVTTEFLADMEADIQNRYLEEELPDDLFCTPGSYICKVLYSEQEEGDYGQIAYIPCWDYELMYFRPESQKKIIRKSMERICPVT